MRWGAFTLPRAGGGTALLLLISFLVLTSTWPERPDLANASWAPLAAARATYLAVWAWFLGAWEEAGSPGDVPRGLARLAMGAAVTAPLEAFAYAASAPVASLAWSLAVPLLLAWSLYGVAWFLAATLRRVGWSAILAPVMVMAAVGLGFLDLRLGLGWWTPWFLPHASSVGAAIVTILGAGVTWAFALRAARQAPADGEDTP